MRVQSLAASENAIDDKFLLTQPTPDWSVWGLRYESKGSILERREKKIEQEAMQCGAFKLDSPSIKRVQKPATAKKVDVRDKIDEDDFLKQFMEE
uniref:Uncharacterized protein n=2 Tax=Caenorhabditis japonica TaxID=281687 RepID=A0A8R1IMW2_CAEJA